MAGDWQVVLTADGAVLALTAVPLGRAAIDSRALSESTVRVMRSQACVHHGTTVRLTFPVL